MAVKKRPLLLEIQPACGVVDGEWKSVDSTRTIESIVAATTGPAEAVCGLITFTDGTFEVGVGECLRGYEQLYKGSELLEASEAWLRWCEQWR